MADVKHDVKFFDKVEKTDGGCWRWTGCLSQSGYGQLKRGGKHYRAHRYSYELNFGPIKKDKIILHSCDNPSCVNPDHLSEGTNRDNSIDCAKKGRLNTRRGEKHPNAKLTDASVHEIRLLYKNGKTQAAIARDFSVRQDTISRLVNFKRRAI